MRAGILASRRDRDRLAAAGHPVVGAGKSFGVARPQHRRAQRRIEPSLRLGGIGRIDRQPLDQHLAGARRLRCQRLELRPRRFGIDVVGRHRRHAAPVVDAGRDQLGQRAAAQIGRRLDVHRRPEQHARDRDRPQMIGGGRLRRIAPSACRGLARKFWMMISWIWP